MVPPGGLKHIEEDHEIHLFSPTDFKKSIRFFHASHNFCSLNSQNQICDTKMA
jgi:hypothetical protein